MSDSSSIDPRPRCKLCGRQLRADVKYGYCTKSPDCRKARHRAYAAAYPQKISAKDRAYYAAHREGQKANSRAYYAAHRNEIRLKWAIYCAAHQEELKAKSLAYNAAHREALRAQAQLNRRRKGALPIASCRGINSPGYRGGHYCFCLTCGLALGWKRPSLIAKYKYRPRCRECAARARRKGNSDVTIRKAM